MRVVQVLVVVAFVSLFACNTDSRDPVAPRAPGGLMASIGTDPVSGATIETNQDDYAPGELVRVTGHGWGLGEAVHLDMTEDPDTHGDVTQDVQADSTGAFSVPFYDVQDHDLGVTFTLTATGQTSGSKAVAVFTDAINLKLLGSDNTQHQNVGTEENLGSIAQGTSLSLTCPRGTGLSTSAGGLGSSITISWAVAYAGAGSNNAMLSPVTTFSPGAGSLSGSSETDCIGVGIATTSLTVGTTYHGSLRATSSTSGVNAGDYFFAFTVSAPSKTTPTITWANPGDIVYGTSLSGAQLNATASVAGTFTYSPTPGTLLSAGSGQTLHVDFTPGDGSLYNNASKDVTINVLKAAVTATAGSGSGTYDGSSQAPAVCQVTGAFTGDVSCANSPALVGPDAGIYAIAPVVSGTGLSNYDITPISGSYTIARAPVTATAGGGSGTYNGSTQIPSACSMTGAYIGDLSCANSSSPVGPDAGTFTLTPIVSGTGLSNFEITSVNGSYVIARASVTATAGGGSGTYNGAMQSPAACQVTGSYTGDLTCSNTPEAVGPGAGTTAISPTVHGTGLSNFDITAIGGSYEILKAPVTATAGSGSGTYNGKTQSPSACAVAGAYTGDLSCANAPASVGPDIGTVQINPAVSGTGLINFAITSVAGSYTINKAPVTATAGSGSGTYNGAAQTPSGCAVSGVYTGDLSCSNDPVSVGPGAGTYAISPMVSGTGQSNFAITSVAGSYAIAKANANVTVNGYSGVFDGLMHGATGSAAGVLGENLSGLLDLGASFMYPTGGTAHWTFNATGSNGNYNAAAGNVAITIQAWTLSGFYQPVDMPNTGVVWNTVKNGSTVPLKFEVFAGNVERTDVAAVQSFVQTNVACDTYSPADEIEVTSTGGTILRYDAVAGQFIQNWQTPKLAGLCFLVTMTTQDHSQLKAYFRLK